MGNMDNITFLLPLIVLLYPHAAISCPDLWVGVGDSCYKTSPEPMTWFQAEEYCFLEGGYLIEIHDDDEQASLLSFLPSGNYYWIGLADLANEGVWKWQTNYEEAEYTFWDSQQPSGGGNENCVELCYDTWFWCDWECNNAYNTYEIHALCERPNEAIQA